MQRVPILFLAANPSATPRQSLDDEAREIDTKIRAAKHRDAFNLITQWAVRPDDLLDAFNRYHPQVVHFSGRGNDQSELLLSGRDGQPQPVAKSALADLFRVLGQSVRVVVLNFGDSRPLAAAIAEHVDCVVGMRRAISDRALRYFAAAFYRALAFGRSVDNAFEQGRASLGVEGTGESDAPELLVRAGVDPAAVVLTSSPGPGDREAEPKVSREAALKDLLVDAFDGDLDGLGRWVRDALGRRIHNELPGGRTSLIQLAFEIMLAAGRHGRVDAALFRSLLAERPTLADRIREVAALHGIDIA